MANLLAPQFFITRPNGDIVPLIALDEVPPHLSIRNIPRTLTRLQTQGMNHLGCIDKRPGFYDVEDSSFPDASRFHTIQGVTESLQAGQMKNIFDHPFASLNPSQYATRTNWIDKADIQNENSPPVHLHPRISGGALVEKTEQNSSRASQRFTPYVTKYFHPDTYPKGREDRQPSPFIYKSPTPSPRVQSTAVASGSPNSQQGLTHNLTQTTSIDPLQRPIAGKKEYCSYWLRHGECDYAQQGCLYKHEMPTDAPTLARLGLREIPRWYRDAHNITPMPGNTIATSGSSGLMKSRWAPRTNIVLSNPNWRISSIATSANSEKASGNKIVSLSPPSRPFALPAPQSPPQSPSTTANAPVSTTAITSATVPAQNPTPVPASTAISPTAPTRLAIRTAPGRLRKPATSASTANAQQTTPSTTAAAATSTPGKTTTPSPTKISKSKFSDSSDPLPSFPALSPVKKTGREPVVVKQEEESSIQGKGGDLVDA